VTCRLLQTRVKLGCAEKPLSKSFPRRTQSGTHAQDLCDELHTLYIAFPIDTMTDAMEVETAELLPVDLPRSLDKSERLWVVPALRLAHTHANHLTRQTSNGHKAHTLHI